MEGETFEGRYALVQFCPIPERMEFINVGLLLTVPSIGFSKIDFVEEPTRVERLFGRQRKEYFQYITDATEFRLQNLLKHKELLLDFEEFSDRRANEIRLTSLLSVRVEGDPEREFDRLFAKLVEAQQKRRGTTRARTRLRKTLKDFDVEHLLERPSTVNLGAYDIKVSAPFAYQNGSYNLIDSIRLPTSHSEGLREAGKKAMEGALLAKQSRLIDRVKLIVVADFAEQSEEFYRGIREHFDDCGVGLFRFDEVHQLVDDIFQASRLSH